MNENEEDSKRKMEVAKWLDKLERWSGNVPSTDNGSRKSKALVKWLKMNCG